MPKLVIIMLWRISLHVSSEIISYTDLLALITQRSYLFRFINYTVSFHSIITLETSLRLGLSMACLYLRNLNKVFLVSNPMQVSPSSRMRGTDNRELIRRWLGQGKTESSRNSDKEEVSSQETDKKKQKKLPETV